MRDVVRCRETFQREILKSRYYILKFLARRGFVFREGTNWCTPHMRWLQHLTTESSPLAVHDRLVFRGISLHSAMVLATEMVDWRRFKRSSQLACYLGLVSREDSSGDRTRLGSITKAGHSHSRHVLVQAAWSYRHRPATSVELSQATADCGGRRSA